MSLPDQDLNRSSIPKKSFELPRYITNTIQFLEFFSTRLALRFALKLFYTPLRFARPNRETKIYEAAKRRVLKNEMDHEYEIMVWGENNQKSILLVHGWSGRGTQFHSLIEELLKKKWKVISFDAPGSGLSQQKQTNLLEFTICCLQLCKEYGPIYHAIGHSLGGGALFNALDQGAEFKYLVSIGTPATIPLVVEDFAFKIKGSRKIAKGILKDIQKKFNVDPEKISSSVLAGKHQPKGLILHDEEDYDVDVKNAYLLHESWTNASLQISSGLGHRKVINDPKSISIILEFLED